MTDTEVEVKRGKGRPKGAPNKPILELVTERRKLFKDADCYEILCQANLVAAENADFAVNGLKYYSDTNGAIKSILRWAFDDNIKSTLPTGETPYKKDDSPESDLAPTSLRFEFKQFKYFVTEQVKQTKREHLWIEMLENIQADGGNMQKWIDKAKDKDDPFRIMGFGHRVYKNFDPRATIIKKSCDDVLEKLGINDPILDLAKQLEQIALNDDYFKSRNLYPNVDFYSGIIYKAIGIPTEMFTVMFAMGRLPGWIAQWKEMIARKEPIGRPRQIYTGPNVRNYTDLENR